MKLRTRARRVLQHIDRWWLTVPMVLDTLFYGGNVDSRKKEVAKLVSNGYLRSFPTSRAVKRIQQLRSKLLAITVSA